MGVHLGSCRIGGRPGKYVAFPVSGGEVRRRHVPYHLPGAGVHVWRVAFAARDGDRSQDGPLGHRRIPPFREEVYVHRRAGVGRALHHRAVLLHHRRLGDEVCLRLYRGWTCGYGGWRHVLLELYHRRHRQLDLHADLHGRGVHHRGARCEGRHREGEPHLDACAYRDGHRNRHLHVDAPRGARRRGILPDARPLEVLPGAGRRCARADVLQLVARHGHHDHLRQLP